MLVVCAQNELEAQPRVGVMYGGADPSSTQIVEFKHTFLKTRIHFILPTHADLLTPPPPALTVKLYVAGHLALRYDAPPYRIPTRYVTTD